MPAPPFKIDGRAGAQLRYMGRDGTARVVTGRRAFVYGCFIDALLTGQAKAGEPYRMRVTPGGPWHRLTLTPAEAVARLETNFIGRRRLARLRRRKDFIATPTHQHEGNPT